MSCSHISTSMLSSRRILPLLFLRSLLRSISGMKTSRVFRSRATRRSHHAGYNRDGGASDRLVYVYDLGTRRAPPAISLAFQYSIGQEISRMALRRPDRENDSDDRGFCGHRTFSSGHE